MHLSQVVLLALFATANAATVSHDAKCGASGGGRTCLGSQWGSCCSQHGWCGSADTYCGTGCQSKFGTCDGGSNPSPNPSPRPSPIVSKPVSKNARCGTGFGGTTCLGSKWGDCCSQYSYCGSSSDYCAPKKGCQDQFGRCDGTPIVSSSRSSSLVVSSKASTSSAQPSPTKACDPIDAVINILNGPLQGQASSFCLSYLGGDKTVEQTSTLIVSGPARTAIVTAPDETNIATADVTNVNLITRTSYVQLPDVTSTQYVTIIGATKTIYAKRRGSDLEARADLPAQLQPFAATRISSACSCIATPGVRTVLATQIQSTQGAEVTSLVPGATVTSTVYQTVQVTSEATVVETLPPTAVAVQTVATSIQPILVKPKICNAKGLPGPNAFNYGANFNSDQANCIATCKIDARCFSTGFYQVTNPNTGTITGTCRYYDKSVTDSASLGVGYYNFNDKAC